MVKSLLLALAIFSDVIYFVVPIIVPKETLKKFYIFWTNSVSLLFAKNVMWHEHVSACQLRI